MRKMAYLHSTAGAQSRLLCSDLHRRCASYTAEFICAADLATWQFEHKPDHCLSGVMCKLCEWDTLTYQWQLHSQALECSGLRLNCTDMVAAAQLSYDGAQGFA